MNQNKQKIIIFSTLLIVATILFIFVPGNYSLGVGKKVYDNVMSHKVQDGYLKSDLFGIEL